MDSICIFELYIYKLLCTQLRKFEYCVSGGFKKLVLKYHNIYRCHELASEFPLKITCGLNIRNKIKKEGKLNKTDHSW